MTLLALPFLLFSCRPQPEQTTAPPVTQPAALPATMLPEPPAPGLASPSGLPWWNDRVFYEVFVRSFKDSDGDGIGDLQGLIEKLDYLNDGDPATTSDLGITGLWLMPVAESPSYHGYDVVDYRTIEQDYGSIADFKKLVEEAHRRGIAVIVDMVLNHTSSQHPWFQDATVPGSPTEHWYIWSAEKPDYRSPQNTPVWHQLNRSEVTDPRAYHGLSDYYYGLFWEGMPDLNYRNDAVTQEMFDISKFWLQDLGVDGFRLDAVRHLIEDGPMLENTPETHAWLHNFDHYVHTVSPEALMVGEIWDDTAAVAPYVPDEVDMAFEFKLSEAIIAALNNGTNGRLVKQVQEVLDSYPTGQFAPFLTNHDMTRAITQLRSNSDKAKLAATVLLTMPGVPFIYYGEEIGLPGVKVEDINVRLPMRWDDSTNAGFTSGAPWHELGRVPPGTNVAAQVNDPDLLLSHYREMLRLRADHAALRSGESWVVQSSRPQVFSLLRAGANEAVLLVANLSSRPASRFQLDLAAGPFSGQVEADLLLGAGTPSAPRPNDGGGFSAYTPLPEIPPYGALLLRLSW